MKSNIIVVIKKELSRFFGDRRLMLSTILLPGLLIYIVYSFMGSAISGMFQPEEGYKYMVSAVNLPQSVSSMIGGEDVEITEIASSGIESARSSVADKKLDLLMVFTEDFDEKVAAYDSSSGEEAPRAELYYNSTRTESSTVFSTVAAMLDAYESSLANKFDVNPGEDGFDLATDKDASGFMFSSMLPMLLMIFLFSGCMAVAPEAIAGEKERGTIATMLITPVKRSELATGKILALAVVALLAGASSTLGTLLSLPKLMGGATDGMSAAFYGAADYAMLAAVILSTVLLLISIISIVSAYAKTIKEAQTYVMPLMILVMLVGVTAMFGNGAPSSTVYYLIPVYNSVQCMSAIFSFNAVASHMLITVAMNLVLAVVGGIILTKMFNSENIMFNK